MKNKIMIAAGGTGGHVYPAIAVAKKLKESGACVEWIGSAKSIESRVVQQEGLIFHHIPVWGLRGAKHWRLCLAPFMLIFSIVVSIRILARVRPSVILGMGGYVSGPVGLAAFLLRVNLIIHEQNSVPGLTNNILSNFATTVLEGFPNSFEKKRGALFVGNPVRTEIENLPPPSERYSNISKGLKIFIFGGSRGASILNLLVPEVIAKSGIPFIKIIHQSGEQLFDKTIEAYEKVGLTDRVQVMSFIDDIAKVYGESHLVICRAGASSIAEISSFGIASILIPYKHAVDNHQMKNANFLTHNGGAIKINEDENIKINLQENLISICNEIKNFELMATLARQSRKENAVSSIVECCLGNTK